MLLILSHQWVFLLGITGITVRFRRVSPCICPVLGRRCQNGEKRLKVLKVWFMTVLGGWEVYPLYMPRVGEEYLGITVNNWE